MQMMLVAFPWPDASRPPAVKPEWLMKSPRDHLALPVTLPEKTRRSASFLLRRERRKRTCPSGQGASDQKRRGGSASSRLSCTAALASGSHSVERADGNSATQEQEREE